MENKYKHTNTPQYSINMSLSAQMWGKITMHSAPIAL